MLSLASNVTPIETQMFAAGVSKAIGFPCGVVSKAIVVADAGTELNGIGTVCDLATDDAIQIKTIDTIAKVGTPIRLAEHESNNIGSTFLKGCGKSARTDRGCCQLTPRAQQQERATDVCLPSKDANFGLQDGLKMTH
jgi:hypothetical protein